MPLNGAALARLLHSDDGPVARMVFDAATRVQDAARQQVGKDTLNLERSIVKRPFSGAGEVGVHVGSDVPYALIHHEGRGPIVAAPGRVLRFKAGGQVLFRKSVGAAKPNRYLTDNLRRAQP